MATRVTALCAVHGPQESAVVLALGSPGSRVEVTRRCGDVAELLAAASAGIGRVAVVSADLPGLDREVVARLRLEGVRVVILAGDEPADRLVALGVDVVLEDAADPRLLDAVHEVVASTGGPVVEGDVPAPPRQEPTATGAVVAVWGPVGAPGRTTVAVELAAELAGAGVAEARRGSRKQPDGDTGQVALLVDADTHGSCVAARLGLLDDAAGVAAAARAAGQGTLDLEALARIAPVITGRLRVLTGLTRAARWPELPASSLEVVLERARSLAHWTVVDCGPSIEADELLMYDTHAPQRNAATLTALRCADVVVVVGAADPIGIQRLVRALEDLDEAPVPVTAPRVVVANRLRASAVGPEPARAVTEALTRYAGVAEVHLLPDDGAVLDAAVLAGRTLAEHAPSCSVRRALEDVAHQVRGLAGAPVPA